MTDEIVHTAPEHSVTPATPPTDPAADRARLLLGAVAVLALIMLIGGYLLWRNGSGSTDQVAQLQGQIGALQGRLDKMEARPAPDLRPLEQRLAALEQKPAPVAVDLRPLEQRITAVEQKPVPVPVDLQPLEQRITAQEQKPVPQATLDAASQQQIAGVSSRIDGVAARQNQLGTMEQSDVAKLNDQIADLNTRMVAVTKAGSGFATLSERQVRTARLQMANGALQSGKPLGEIPGAPPALAQFATKPPPTEAALRLSFDAAATTAHEAGQPPKETTPFLSRMWDRAQSGVTVRQGEKILVGDAVSGVLEHSRHLLDAGDLPGAVGALDALTGPAAAAMAGWRGQAQSLLDARAALISAANG